MYIGSIYIAKREERKKERRKRGVRIGNVGKYCITGK